jgi:5-oxoprolinase (ATP-hydrolysing)
MTDSRPWQFWIDRGGTFTDIVALQPDGGLVTSKLLSDNPASYDDAAAEGIRQALSEWQAAGQTGAPIEAVKMGTTVATNALLERQGTPTALVVTQGFADALQIVRKWSKSRNGWLPMVKSSSPSTKTRSALPCATSNKPASSQSRYA